MFRPRPSLLRLPLRSLHTTPTRLATASTARSSTSRMVTNARESGTNGLVRAGLITVLLFAGTALVFRARDRVEAREHPLSGTPPASESAKLETARRVGIAKNPDPLPPVTELQTKLLAATTATLSGTKGEESTPPPPTTTSTPEASGGEKGASGATTGEEEEGEHSPQAAYNPETGEINWDCPCLGGMADGPCGPEFKEAFSCFVFSEAEPKGVDCVERFRGMQECFRRHPDIYGSDIEEDEDEDGPNSLENQAMAYLETPDEAFLSEH